MGPCPHRELKPRPTVSYKRANGRQFTLGGATMLSRPMWFGVLAVGALVASPTVAQVSYQGPGCGPPGTYGCAGQRPYAGPGNGPPGYSRGRGDVTGSVTRGPVYRGGGYGERPYAGPGNGPPGYRSRAQRPYAGPGNGPPGYRGDYRVERPYAGPGNGPPGNYRY
jgi:hypothetical protein